MTKTRRQQLGRILREPKNVQRIANEIDEIRHVRNKLLEEKFPNMYTSTSLYKHWADVNEEAIEIGLKNNKISPETLAVIQPPRFSPFYNVKSHSDNTYSRKISSHGKNVLAFSDLLRSYFMKINKPKRRLINAEIIDKDTLEFVDRKRIKPSFRTLSGQRKTDAIMNDVENKKFRSAIRAYIKEEMPKRIKQMKEETKKEIENGKRYGVPSNNKYKEWASRQLSEYAYDKLYSHTPQGRIENLRSKFKQGLSDRERGK